MTQKQYADMTTIMQFGRIFSEQMKKCLVNSGLWEKGFCFCVDAYPTHCSDNVDLSGSVRIFRGYDNPENDHSEDMFQLNYDGKGWRVVNDPIAEAGSLPPEVHARERRDFNERIRENPSKPYPLDGMWISSFDDPPVLGGGR